jgi:hypothetical protein
MYSFLSGGESGISLAIQPILHQRGSSSFETLIINGYTHNTTAIIGIIIMTTIHHGLFKKTLKGNAITGIRPIIDVFFFEEADSYCLLLHCGHFNLDSVFIVCFQVHSLPQ